MDLLRSLNKRKTSTIFFILSFTITFLIFSIGSSSTISYERKSREVNPENNKLIVLVETKGVTFDDIVNTLKDDKVSILFQYEDVSNGLMVESVVLGKEQEKFLDIQEGDKTYSDSLFNGKNSGIFSTRIPSDEVKLQSGDKSMNVERVKSFYEIQMKIIIPYETFKYIYDKGDINESQTFVVIRGDEREIEKGVEKLGSYLKEKDPSSNISLLPYQTYIKSVEGEVLSGSTILIIIIAIINSLSISSLWVKSRRKEITLRKVFGANDKDIAIIFFGEILIISIISLILALGIQYIISIATNGFISTIDIRLTPGNFLISSLLAIITSIAVTGVSLRNISKVQAIEMLRGE